MIYVMYNPLAGNSTCEESSKGVKEIFGDNEISFVDLVSVDNIEKYIKGLNPDDQIVICGGDGTLNYLINHIDIADLEQDVLYYPAGSGNDFYHDIDEDRMNGAYRINHYLQCLPTVEVNGMKKLFLNGIGYGIDGYCCEEGDKEREKNPGKRVNYTKIALRGVLYDFKPVNAKVTVDGVTKEYKNVWMAPAMNGRFYGGGMMCAPNQDRLNEKGLVSVIVVTSKSRFKILAVFPSIFKGEHLKHKSLATEIMGSDITVEFDRPTALQIDGETVRNVLTYSVHKDKGIIIQK